MTQQLTKTISKKALALLIGAFIICSSAQRSYALPRNPDTKSKGVEVSYKGQQDNKLLFDISYKNEVAEPFELIVRGDLDDIIYRKQFDASPLNTKLLFSQIPDDYKLTFVIKTGKKEVSEVFEITTQVKTVEEVIVKGI